MKQALVYHPNKNQDKTTEEMNLCADKYEELQTNMQSINEAYNCLIGVTAEGYLGRVLYDQKYDLIISS